MRELHLFDFEFVAWVLLAYLLLDNFQVVVEILLAQVALTISGVKL